MLPTFGWFELVLGSCLSVMSWLDLRVEVGCLYFQWVVYYFMNGVCASFYQQRVGYGNAPKGQGGRRFLLLILRLTVGS